MTAKIDIKYEMTIELNDLEKGKQIIKLSKKDAEDLYNALFYALGKQSSISYPPSVRDFEKSVPVSPLMPYTTPWPNTGAPSPTWKFGEILCSVEHTK